LREEGGGEKGKRGDFESNDYLGWGRGKRGRHFRAFDVKGGFTRYIVVVSRVNGGGRSASGGGRTGSAKVRSPLSGWGIAWQQDVDSKHLCGRGARPSILVKRCGGEKWQSKGPMDINGHKVWSRKEELPLSQGTVYDMPRLPKVGEGWGNTPKPNTRYAGTVVVGCWVEKTKDNK